MLHSLTGVRNCVTMHGVTGPSSGRDGAALSVHQTTVGVVIVCHGVGLEVAVVLVVIDSVSRGGIVAVVGGLDTQWIVTARP